MANRFTTKVNMNDGRRKGSPGKRKQISRMELAARNSPRAFQALKKYKLSKATRQKIKKVALLCLGLFMVIGVLGGVWFFSYLQKINDELPPVENPFRDKELSSVIYDRNGTQLYKLFNHFNRDSVNIEEIPERVKWAFIAAEDIDFYTHQGFDPAAILRCGLRYISSAGGAVCGGSTITQQMVKITTEETEVKLERKIRELLFALKIEQAYTKDQILQMYLTVAPFGSSLYGITAASRFYYGKEPKDLTLAEGAILAAIIQNPARLAPTLGSNPENSQKLVKERQEYVLGQLQVYMDKINTQTRVNADNPELEDVLTEEMIEAAKVEQLNYRPPIATDKKAGHFVDYAMELLQERNYKNGEEPFTLSELQTGGYKIYTTLDYDLQQIAEQTAKDAVDQYGTDFEFHNAALMTTQPSTGEILTMVGSKSYYLPSEPADCKGLECVFDGQVNVFANERSPGSSTKPYGTYEAYRQGKLFSGSVLPDVPIDIGGGYSIKNWNGTFMGVNDQTTAGQMLRISRNLPAIAILQAIGMPKFLETLRGFGYTTFLDDSNYGPSVILGGSGVKGIEHAQGYGVFANGGDLIRHEVISKIVDREGNTIYEHKPERTRVADERAAFMLNQTLLNNHSLSWDGREIAAKSGTSEDSTDAWIVMWSPDFVTVSWIGNNNSTTMNFNAFGESAVAPWVKNYMRQIGDSQYFGAATPFPRPAGITEGGGDCPEAPKCEGSYQGLSSGYMLDDVDYATDVTYTKIRVCKDQKDRIARPIDEAVGMAEDSVGIYYRMVAPEYQGFLDNYMYDQATQGKGMPNGGPKDPCDKDRSGTGTNNPFLSGYAPTISGGAPFVVNVTGNAYASAGAVTKVDFYFDTTVVDATRLIGTITTGFTPFNQNFNVPAQYNNDKGTYTLLAVVTDNGGRTGANSQVLTLNPASPNVNLSLSGSTTFTFDNVVAANNNRLFTFTYSGAPAPLANDRLQVTRNGVAQPAIDMTGSSSPFTYTYSFPNPGPATTHTYQFYSTVGKGLTGTLITNVINVTVNGI
jgi:penicillin-binding protein 1A